MKTKKFVYFVFPLLGLLAFSFFSWRAMRADAQDLPFFGLSAISTVAALVYYALFCFLGRFWWSANRKNALGSSMIAIILTFPAPLSQPLIERSFRSHWILLLAPVAETSAYALRLATPASFWVMPMIWRGSSPAD